jgi:hypothetical protein
LALVDRGLIGQFIGTWTSQKTVAFWLEKILKPLIKGSLNHLFFHKGFFTCLFEHKEDEDLIFHSGPYFLGVRGMHFNKWTLYFNPENNVPSTILVWVWLPLLPLHCWSDDALKRIGNFIDRFIENPEPKENLFSCVEI